MMPHMAGLSVLPASEGAGVEMSIALSKTFRRA